MRALLSEEGAVPECAVAASAARIAGTAKRKALAGKDDVSDDSADVKKRKRAPSSKSEESHSSSQAKKAKPSTGKKLSKKERKKVKKEKKAEKKKGKKQAKEKEKDKTKANKAEEHAKGAGEDASAGECHGVALKDAVASGEDAVAERLARAGAGTARAAAAAPCPQTGRKSESDEEKAAKKSSKVERRRKKKEKKCKKREEEVDSMDDAEELLVWDRLILTRRDFVSLAPGSMLNDSMMDFALRMIHRCLAPRADVYLFSCLFFTRLMAAGVNDGNQGWENVKGWTKNVAVFTYEYLFIPINSITISKVRHWWLAVVKLHGPDGRFSPSITWFDTNPDFDHTQVYSVALRFLKGYLRREWVERPASRPAADAQGGFDAARLGKGATQRVPHQENAVDCGVFLLENVFRLLSGADRWLATVSGGSARGEGAQETLWCDQSQATRRREDLQKSLDKLVVAAAGVSASCGGRPSVPRALDDEPELNKFLLDSCKLPADWHRAVETGGCRSSEPAAADASTVRLDLTVGAVLNGIWVDANSGELAGEIEGGKLTGPGGDLHSINLRSPFKFTVVIAGNERTANVSHEKLIWDNGEIWKRLKEDDAATASSDDSEAAAGERAAITSAGDPGVVVVSHGIGSVADMAAWAAA